jgi:N utilization substance protein A
MELYIKRDQHAEQIFEGQMDKAKHLLMEILHIDEETAGVLTASGLGDIHTYDNVESSDLIDILVCDEEFANSLLIKAKEYLNSH